MPIEVSYDSDELCDKAINISLEDTIKNYKNGGTVLLELPAESYFIANSASVRYLTDHDFKGVYVSFQRPFDNICTQFDNCCINKDNLIILDFTAIFCDKKYAKISPKDLDAIFNSIIKSLNKLKCKNKFVLIDSLSTCALYKSDSDVEKLAEKLVNINNDNLLVLFNIAEDLIKKQYIKKISSYADSVINISECVDKYSRDIVKPSLLT